VSEYIFDKGFSKKLQPLADDLYRQIFPILKLGEVRSIKRNNGKPEDDVLDKEFHSDLRIITNKGLSSLQEKFRRYKNLQYDNLTVEYIHDLALREGILSSRSQDALPVLNISKFCTSDTSEYIISYVYAGVIYTCAYTNEIVLFLLVRVVLEICQGGGGK